MGLLRNAKLRLQFGLWGKIRANNYHSFYLSHSLFGEDMVVRALLAEVRKGFYIDIGAHHPVFSSNTYHFYERGWRGINIDAAPGSMEIFRQVRPRDINLELCISSSENSAIRFFLFEDGLLNTADPETAARAQATGHRLAGEVTVASKTLSQIFAEYLPNGTEIDYLNIDVEGLDEPILKSNDWNRFRPHVVSFECHLSQGDRFDEIPMLRFLAAKGYEFQAKCGSTIIVQRLP